MDSPQSTQSSYWSIDDYPERVYASTSSSSPKYNLKSKRRTGTAPTKNVAKKSKASTPKNTTTDAGIDSTPKKGICENPFLVRAPNDKPKPCSSTTRFNLRREQVAAATPAAAAAAEPSAGTAAAGRSKPESDAQAQTDSSVPEKSWSLGFGRQVQITTFQGEVRIDIRLWEDFCKRPTTKGVSLTLNRYKALTLALPRAKQIIEILYRY